jgi:hypothetical protein
MAMDIQHRKLKRTTEKLALHCNPQGERRHGHPRKTWKRTVKEEANEGGKTWSVLYSTTKSDRN